MKNHGMRYILELEDATPLLQHMSGLPRGADTVDQTEKH